MARAEKLREHLPYLFRPEAGTDSLINDYLEALGEAMDLSSSQLHAVMQAHWFRFSDKASFDEHAQLARTREGLAPFNVRDPDDQLSILRYPYIADLARLGQMVPVSPWQEPINQRDLVENYRRRIAAIVGIYKNGVGTLQALRDRVAAELPLSLELPLAQRERSFLIEESTSFEALAVPVTQAGEPVDKVGPMMRWQINRTSQHPAQPQIIFEGLAPVPGEIEATSQPMVERFAPSGDGLLGLAIGYTGDLAAGEALRLRSCDQTWLLLNGQVHRSPPADDTNQTSGPASNGPWQLMPDTPAVNFSHMLQSPCKSLWLAGDEQLWRLTPAGFEQALAGVTISPINDLGILGQHLFLATATGLQQMPLYPADGVYTLTPVLAFAGIAIHGLYNRDNELWVAGDQGLTRLHFNSGDELMVDAPTVTIPSFCVHFDANFWLIGCELGLLRFDANSLQWHIYRGETSEQPDQQWLVLDLTAPPPADSLQLPAVQHIAATPDQSLWLGTQSGLVRYYARRERELLFRSSLEAFPDLIPDAITSLSVDARGLLWVGSNRGLFRYDGRDLAQYIDAENHWQQLGRANAIYPNELQAVARSSWRFDRLNSQWQQLNSAQTRWAVHTLAQRSQVQTAAAAVTNATGIIAHLGQLVGDVFEASGPALAEDQLFMRAKPDFETIVDGGFPCLPSLPPGTSTWRYLQRELTPTEVPDDLPWWSREGRLFPPPPEEPDVKPGRFRDNKDYLDGEFDESIFSYCPSAKVTFIYHDGPAQGVCVRLFLRGPQDTIDPVITQRVAAGIQRVRPAGIPVKLLVEGQLIGA